MGLPTSTVLEIVKAQQNRLRVAIKDNEPVSIYIRGLGYFMSPGSREEWQERALEEREALHPGEFDVEKAGGLPSQKLHGTIPVDLTITERRKQYDEAVDEYKRKKQQKEDKK